MKFFKPFPCHYNFICSGYYFPEQGGPNPKRSRITDDRLPQGCRHLLRLLPPVFFIKKDGKLVKVIRHDRVAGWNRTVIHFFFTDDHICLACFGVIEKGGSCFWKLVHHV